MTAQLQGAGGEVSAVLGRVYLHPGEYAVSAEPVVMTTILGSCVAVALHDRLARVGGLTHFLLPRAPAGEAAARFGSVAVPLLLHRAEAAGADASRLRARIFGGACELDAHRGTPEHVGRLNVRVALETLAEAGIPVVAMEVEGHRARRVFFDAQTGEVVVRAL
jgi:chemotaxis protein CheD